MPRPSEREDTAPEPLDEPEAATPAERSQLEARCEELQQRLLL